MASDALQKARDFENRYLSFTGQYQPNFHVTGGIGWINDPNGFAMYKGEYHLFFQYHPYFTKWGPMHWGHVKTKDFIRWERLPAALAPDEEYDRDGCFSGSAVEMPDGRHLLMYTGVRGVRGEDGTPVDFQTQCIAVGDGVDYVKYGDNPVIGADLVPNGYSVNDFRDPKIWREGDVYRVAVACRGVDGCGAILLYRSGDAFHWSFETIAAASEGTLGRMWECPDYFHLDGRDVLLVSQQEMPARGLEFHPGNTSACLIGVPGGSLGRLRQEFMHAIDYGTDFYAPQTLESADGRRIMIAWMQNWDTSSVVPKLPFLGQMTLPRELSVRVGRLCQLPVRELESYRGGKVSFTDIPVEGEVRLPGVSGRCLDMTVTVRRGKGMDGVQCFRMYLAAGEKNRTMLRYRPGSGTIKVDRTHSGFPHDIVNIREFPVRRDISMLKLRIILDRYSLELFVNDGEQAASFILYTPEEDADIYFTCEGSAEIDVEKYELIIE